MAEQISYLARNFSDFQTELRELTAKYYPELVQGLHDGAIGDWMVDLVAAVSDDLSFHIDRSLQETNLDSAQTRGAIMDMARNNGFKVPGKKCAVCECEFSCEVPVNGSYNNNSALQNPNYDYAPIIKRGTLVTNGTTKFEVMQDINFKEQFNYEGVSDRIIKPKYDSNGNIEKYILKKLGLVVAGESKIFRKIIQESDIVPFMQITLQDSNAVSVESIICKDGTNFKTDPNINDFFISEEYVAANTANHLSTDTYRYFEVESLAEQYRFGDVTNSDGVPQGEEVEWTEEDGTKVVSPFIYKGEWKTLKQKFITEFTDNGMLKITFGSGYKTPNLENYEAKGYDTLYQISHMVNNDYLGKLPSVGQTMFVLYRVGGGASSNVATGAINSIVYSNIEITGDGTCSTTDLQTIANVKNSITVKNTIPSLGGKDMPSTDEIRYLTMYNASAQDRCVTVKDYHARIMKIPPRYGCPFRVSVAEENNKVAIYTLFTDYKGHLTSQLPSVLAENIEDYLSEYKMINDYVEIKSGRVINLSFEVDIFVDKAKNSTDVVKNVIDTIRDYMDINKHQMGEDIFIGDLEKQIMMVEGVLSLIDLRVYNEYGSKYSSDQTSQDRVTTTSCLYGDADDDLSTNEDRFQIDLRNNDSMLFCDFDAMFEIKYPNATDIAVRVKQK